MKRAIFVLLVCLFNCIAWTLSAQIKITATGTGNTTGHVANLTIDNKGKSPIEINEQTAFIPSDGQYQPYIVTIPKTTIPPGATTIPLPGYCADVTTPPVPTGDRMPPIDDWIAITPVTRPGPGTVPVDIVEKTVPRFTIESIPGITISTGYTPKPPPAIPGVGLTWPGTDIIVGGVLDPDTDPKSSAPVLIEALQNIAEAYDKLQGEGGINTPFSGDPEKERESVIQQTFWIYAAGLSGKRYQKDNFNNRVIEQYENNSGIKVAAMPEPEKKKLDEGVDAFWNTFTAVGVEAKVLQAAESTTITPTTTTLDQTQPNSNDPPVLIKEEGNKKGKCQCDSSKITLTVNIANRDGQYLIPEGVGKQKAIFKKGTSTHGLNKITAVSFPDPVKGDKVKISANTEIFCTCITGGAKCDGITSPTLKVMQGKKDLTENFSLEKVPDNFVVTVTQTCENDDCKIATCSVTIPVEIRAESKSEKAAREKKAEDDADKAKEKEKEEKKKSK